MPQFYSHLFPSMIVELSQVMLANHGMLKVLLEQLEHNKGTRIYNLRSLTLRRHLLCDKIHTAFLSNLKFTFTKMTNHESMTNDEQKKRKLTCI